MRHKLSEYLKIAQKTCRKDKILQRSHRSLGTSDRCKGTQNVVNDAKMTATIPKDVNIP